MRWSWLLCLVALVSSIATPGAARRKNPMVFFPKHPELLRAVRYSRMESADCLEELALRGIEFTRGKRTAGIQAAVTLNKTVRGVRFEHVYPGSDKGPGPLMDCRLALALDDLALIASSYQIAEIRYSSTYRAHSRRGGRGHRAGVAIDINEFVQEDGSVLNVLEDFEGAGIGSRTCGEQAPKARSSKAIVLRELVCALDRAGSFNLLLTPHYDKRHQNHFHLEVRPGIEWFLTQ